MTPYWHLVCVGLAALIGVLHIALQALSATRDTGVKWNAGPRDEPHPVGRMAGRLDRAFANFRETFPLFVAAVIAAYLAARLSDVTLVASIAYVVARLIYIPLYAFGVTYLRSIAFMVALGAILVILASLLLP